ncbi:amidoxime reducing component [Artemisia annua]|uniref:Amidoxime reducing component n=1 Tax=Artemisia annua TaxID=35608 RepID=A0A2U1KBH7_ARTAN|nr:amidoxime reducing component [Artemisia annua]
MDEEMQVITEEDLSWISHWVVVNSKGRGCSQRVEPKLGLIQVELPLRLLSLLELLLPSFDLFLTVVHAPGMTELKLSLSKPSLLSDGVLVSEWSASAFDEGDEAAYFYANTITTSFQGAFKERISIEAIISLIAELSADLLDLFIKSPRCIEIISSRKTKVMMIQMAAVLQGETGGKGKNFVEVLYA